MNAGGGLLGLRHEGRAAQAGVADLLVLVRVSRTGGHGRNEHHVGVVALHTVHHRAVAVAVAPGCGGGIVGLLVAQFHGRVLHRRAAVLHHALDRVAIGKTEVDDRLHILRHHVAGPAAALNDGGSDGRGDKGKERGGLIAVSRNGVRVRADVTRQRFERLGGDVGRERFKRAHHGGIEPHREGAADDVRDGAGKMGERGAAVGAARVPADGADRQLQIGVALLHQIDLRDGNIGRAESRAGFDLAAALV